MSYKKLLEQIKNLVLSVIIATVIIVHTLFKGVLWFIIVLGYKWFLHGSNFWIVRERKDTPLCLKDETLGRHDFAHFKNIRIHYVESGNRSNPLMLFVHGFPEFWYTWKHQIKHFSKTHRVVAMDMRGFGYSERPKKLEEYRMEYLEQDIYNMINFLGRSRCILIGHDWGASVCYYVASKYPSLIEKLIILNGGHPKVFKQTLLKSITLQIWKSWYMFGFMLPVMPELLFYIDDLTFLDDTYKTSDNSNVLSKTDLEAFKHVLSKKECLTSGFNLYRCSMWKNGKLNPPDSMADIKVETCIIWGDDDRYFISETPELTKEFIHNLTIHHIPGGSHFIQGHKPEQVNSLIEKFLQSRLY